MNEKIEETTEFKGRLRIAGKDINGSIQVNKALAKIKGIGTNLAESISEIIEEQLKIPKTTKIGNVSDEDLKKIEEIITNLTKYGIPKYMINRQKDRETGEYKHLISSDLDFQMEQDKKNEINMKSYRGVRHMFGLPVRGQRTKTMGRKGLTLGVHIKKEKPQTTGKKEATVTQKKK